MTELFLDQKGVAIIQFSTSLDGFTFSRTALDVLEFIPEFDTGSIEAAISRIIEQIKSWMIVVL